jgi:hypothetical protein
MRKFALPICLFFLAALSSADVSDTVWKALLQKSVIVVTTDGSEVSGELAVVESDQVVVIKPDVHRRARAELGSPIASGAEVTRK